MTITLPDEMRDEIEPKASANGFHAVEHHLCFLVIADDPDDDTAVAPVSFRNWPRAELDRLIEEGLNSGPPILVDEQFWRDLDRRAAERAAARRGQADPCRVIELNTRREGT